MSFERLNRQRTGAHLVGKTVCDFDQLGRVLAERQRRGPGYIYDVLSRRRQYP
jgi:hypothetical protein